MKWETKSEPYMWGLPIGAMLGIAFWMLFDDPIFGRKGHEKHELSLADVSAVTFQDNTMVVSPGAKTFELSGAGDEEGLRRFVEELQPLLERGRL